MLTSADTGLKPFSCERCGQHFSRLDSLSRHTKRHTSGSQGTDGTRHTIDTIVSSEQERATSFHSIDTQSTVEETYTPGATYLPATDLPISDEMVPGDSSNYLNWPDSTDLLQSILSAEFVNLPSLELFPAQPMLPAAALPADATHSSPGSNLGDQQSPWLGGENAVQNLSQIIKNTVRQFY